MGDMNLVDIATWSPESVRLMDKAASILETISAKGLDAVKANVKEYEDYLAIKDFIDAGLLSARGGVYRRRIYQLNYVVWKTS